MNTAKENKKDATMWIMDFLIGVLWIGSIWLCYTYMKQALVAPDINHCVEVTNVAKSPQEIMLREACIKYGVPVTIARRVWFRESTYGTNLNMMDGNCVGHFQMSPEACEDVGFKHADMIYDYEAINAGVAYLRWCYNRTGGRWKFAVLAFRAGVGNVAKYEAGEPNNITCKMISYVYYCLEKGE